MLTPRFQNPAEGYVETLDWQRLLVQHPASTFQFQMEGDSMSPLVRPGAVLIVDRALPTLVGRLTVVEYENEFLLRRLEMRDGHIVLVAENPASATLPQEQVTFWGMVVWILHNPWKHP